MAAAAATSVKRASKKSSKSASHPPYKDMIVSAVITLKDRNGSSRQGIKKWILSKHGNVSDKFDSMLNQAIRRGVENGDFIQPKGPSGPLKLNKSGSTPSTRRTSKPASDKTTTSSRVSKSTPAAKKKSASVKKTSASKAKTASVTKRVSKAPAKSKRTSGAATTSRAPKQRSSARA